ncbi:hypothetical protein DW655_14365 [Lachnospiraceae bacterium AM23-2LB]|nr:hypothetical protein DW655_14365 [Lachnospiraceae bacterium AM23-2LB]RJW01513.1 hypothetical protein DW887_13150 [Lachnospiraceae bacterium AM40-2BH]DAW20313.1 MAG TPA: hypothetical protein [Caudoviricetes sp.]
MSKEELLYELDNAITVRQLINKLERYDQDTIVVNSCRDDLPIANIDDTVVDYCYDEIISKRVVSIW